MYVLSYLLGRLFKGFETATLVRRKALKAHLAGTRPSEAADFSA